MAGTGKITKEYTAWCGYCCEFEQMSFVRNVKETLAAVRELGWKMKDGKLACVNCVREGEDDR